jgi:two-component system, cell cycle response regulator
MQQQILIIDDSPPIHVLAKALLAHESIQIHSATDAEYGLILAASMKPDLILLDVDMPGIDGFEACKRLKADPETAGVPVIFLTSLSSVHEKVKGLELGAVDYITKPFNKAELWARVRASLRNSYYFRLLAEKALIDPLTGLGNRAMFDQRLASEFALHVRFGNTISCILVDVDRFKNINDTYGHLFGDEVLKKISRIIEVTCRLGDIACRFGGEEFAIIAPHAAVDSAALLAERIRARIVATPFVHEGNPVSVTCSFGVAETLDTFDRTIIDRADAALYRSKKEGRNRISTSLKLTGDRAAA